MAHEDASDASRRRRGLSVCISHVDCSPKYQTQYVIRVTDFHADAYERTVRRPYSEFRRLRLHLLDVLKKLKDDELSQKCYKQIEVLVFPPKRLFGSRSESVVRTRAKTLNKWITRVLAVTTDYRKEQKLLATENPSMSTEGSVLVLEVLKTFFTSRVEELNLAPLQRSQSARVPAATEVRVASRNIAASYNEHSNTNRMVTHEGPPVVASRAWPDEKPSMVINKSILKSGDRPSRLSPSRRTRTQFSEPSPYISDASSSHQTKNNPVDTHRSSSSTASSTENSFISTPSGRTKSNLTRLSLAKTEMAPSTINRSIISTTNHSMIQGNTGRQSVVKDARFSLAKPKVNKRLPAGNEADIIAEVERELLDTGLTVDTAHMLLRYIDRFLVKATQRMPGCYRITPDNWLAIDAERLCMELEDALFDPTSMQLVLCGDGEWRIPTALEGYIQHKWAVHHNKAMDELGDESEPELDDEVVTKSTRKTQPRFSRHDIDEIEQMMNDGNASRSQVKQLRRQLEEGNWDRRTLRRRGEDEDDDDSDDSLGEEEDIDFETYARRKSRKSRYSAFQTDYTGGGLV
ncbi:hypothetical protein LEN26_015780 [Aphanomyces euteiches]|nr:hypothetical protein LEN26_015780 [Aphanomyces euteiches]KAH9102263.1 hypothetical protein AeMF1_021128 [Aphanomyces euteiches]KAH9197240.1 hypothetical protein AeNC1_000778 [Aphanomyces euteiches]